MSKALADYELLPESGSSTALEEPPYDDDDTAAHLKRRELDFGHASTTSTSRAERKKPISDWTQFEAIIGRSDDPLPEIQPEWQVRVSRYDFDLQALSDHFQHFPHRALSRLLAEKLAEAGESPDESKYRFVVKAVVRALLHAQPATRNTLYAVLIRCCSPDDVLDASLQCYADNARERYLQIARSVVERMGSAAWPALRRFSKSGRWECRYFVDLIAGCENVSESERLVAINSLIQNPFVEVRSRIVESLEEFSEQDQMVIVSTLARDADEDIREQADLWLSNLEQDT